MPTDKPEAPPEPEAGGKTSFLQAMFSVLASFFGVQSERNRKRDFSGGNPILFIGIAIAFTILFVIVLVVIVQRMLHNAGM